MRYDVETGLGWGSFVDDKEPAVTGPVATGAEAAAKADLLVVDDTIANLRLLTNMLARDGYHVRSVTDGTMALNAARKQPPDLVLLDINMPGMDGFEVCEKLKADPDLPEIPVIFISALSDTLDKLRAFKVGGVDYVTKPFDREEVRARVDTHLRLQRLSNRVRLQNTHLLEANRKLQKLTEYEENLMRLIVHDLRAPLSGIMGYLELLQINSVGQLDDEFREDIDKALGVALQMSEVIDSLLDVTRLEREELPMKPVSCNLAEIVRDALANLESVIEYRRIETTLPDLDPIVHADRTLLRRVVVNLLHNALKFTSRSGRIDVAIERRGSFLRTSVADDGPGVDPRFKEQIFDRFGLTDATDRSRGPLPGLGLSFCKLCVEAHGGRVGVDTPEEGGSRFWFDLPAA